MKRLLRLCILGAMAIGCAVNSSAADGDKFKLVKNLSDLRDGDIVIIAKRQNSLIGNRNTALSITQSSTNLSNATPITFDGDIATITDKVELIQLEAVAKKTNVFRLKSTRVNEYLCNGNRSSSYNKLLYLTEKSTDFKNVSEVNVKIDPSTYNVTLEYPKKGSYYLSYICYKLANNPTEEMYGHYSCYQGLITGFFNNDSYSVQLYKKILDSFSISETAADASSITENIGKSVDASLTRTLVADKWNTFCVPFDIDVADGKLNGVEARVMQFESVEGNIMCFSKADKIEAGKPYLIKPTAEIKDPTFADVKLQQVEPIAVGAEDYSFVGVYCQKTFDAAESKKSLFINGNAEFKRPSANSSMKGMRAYFACATEQAASSQLKIGDETTSVSEIVSDADENGYIYNVNGVRVGTDVNGLSKGLYIKKGRKFVVK